MRESFSDRLAHAWNAFKFNERENGTYWQTDIGPSTSIRPDRYYLSYGSERTFINSLYTRIAIDCAAIDVFEAIIDENEIIQQRVKSGLTYALLTEANIDQTGRSLMTDIILSMFDEGVVAVVPVDTDIDPTKSNSYEIKTLRAGKILDWYPQHVKIELYNEKTGQKEDIILPKKNVAIIENPFYSIMNTNNSTLRRLTRKIVLADQIDEQSGSGKMDLIIQLPYVIKSDARRQQAEQRRKDIEMQLANSKYGIAYTDGTEKITQLGHSLENNLQDQIAYLTDQVYKQLGLAPEIFSGTANEQTMLNYYNHTIEPILTAIVEEFSRKFLTKTARTQGHVVAYMRDPFKLVPVNNLAEIADKFTRNEILTSNEIRSLIGFRPSDQPTADELRNKNLNRPDDFTGLLGDQAQADPNAAVEDPNAVPTDDQQQAPEDNQNESEAQEVVMEEGTHPLTKAEYDRQIRVLDGLDDQLDELEESLSHADSTLGRPKNTSGNYANPYYDPDYAHEYYEAHKKSQASTSGLNTAGKEAAYWYKSQLDTQRDAEIESAKNERDSKIATSKTNRDSNINTAQTKRDTMYDTLKNTYNTNVDKSQQTRDTAIEKAKNVKTAANAKSKTTYDTNVQTSKDTKAANVEQNNNEYETKRSAAETLKESNIENDSESTKALIAQYKSQMESQVESLQTQLENMSTEEKKKNKADIQAQIKQLRAENTATRESLNAKHKEYAESERETYKSTNEELKTTKKTANTKEDTEHKSRVAGYKTTYDTEKDEADSTYQTTREDARNAHDSNKKAYKETYDTDKATAKSDYDTTKESEQETHKTNVETYRSEFTTTKQTLKDTYAEKYADIIEKLKSSSKYTDGD